MGGLGGADGQPGHHSPNIGGSVSSKRTITEANGNRCQRLLVLLFRTRNYLGWTGFAIPRMRLRYGVLATGLMVGVLWGGWHFPLFSGSSVTSGVVPPALYLLVLLFSVLPAFRVLMVWVYDRTGSLLVAILTHVSLTASTLIFMPLATSGVTAVTYDLVLAAALWVVVGAVALANGGHLTRQPPPRRQVA